jgi:hypothetical protein
MDDLIQRLRKLHRDRDFCIKSQTRQMNAIRALVRTVLGWTPDLSETEKERIRKAADDMVKAVEKGGAVPSHPELHDMILAAAMARAPFDAMRSQIDREMAAIVKELPIWKWAEGVRGLGAVGVATIIGACGDLSNYPNPAKVWKRMGVALVNGRRQGSPGPQATADDWIAHGYGPRRRAILWVIGDVLIKQNKDGPYRIGYDMRKAYERAKAQSAGLKIVPAAKIPKKNHEGFMSEGHIHNRAKRWMEKKLLADMWTAWRTTQGLPDPKPA